MFVCVDQACPYADWQFSNNRREHYYAYSKMNHPALTFELKDGRAPIDLGREIQQRFRKSSIPHQDLVLAHHQTSCNLFHASPVLTIVK